MSGTLRLPFNVSVAFYLFSCSIFLYFLPLFLYVLIIEAQPFVKLISFIPCLDLPNFSPHACPVCTYYELVIPYFGHTNPRLHESAII